MASPSINPPSSNPRKVRFHEPADAMAAEGERIVRLRFTKTSHPDLYVHPVILRLWSRVMAHLLEDTACPKTQSSERDGADEDIYMTLPLEDTDAAAWERALHIMYPGQQAFKVTLDNAPGLLDLADKYDMPGVAGEARL